MIALRLFSIDYIGSYNKVGSILPIEDFPRYKYYRALSYVSLYRWNFLYLEIFIICNLKIRYR